MFVRNTVYLCLLFRAQFYLNIFLPDFAEGNHIFKAGLPIHGNGKLLPGSEDVTLMDSLRDNIVPSTVQSPQVTCGSDCFTDYRGSLEDRTLYIGGLFDVGCSCKEGINGLSEQDAAIMAVNDINRLNFIPGFQLKLLINNTKCDAGIATDALYDFIYRRKHKIIMVMGSGCAGVTKTLAEIVPYWNLIMISHATTSPALSERKKYQTFFRLSPGDTSLNPARRMFIQHFRWNTVAALYEDNDLFAVAITDISAHFEVHNITLRPTIAFKDDSDIPEKMGHLKEKDVRIIIGGFSASATRRVFCEAYKLGMYGARYVWILIGGYTWFNMTSDTTCTLQQIKKAMNGFITVSRNVNHLNTEEKPIANLSSSNFQSKYLMENGSRPVSQFIETSYDTVWTIALTLKSALKHWIQTDYFNNTVPNFSNVNYSRIAKLTQTFYNIIENVQFLGVSGPVSFQGPDRIGIVAVYQQQGDHLRPIAIHDPAKNSFDFHCSQCVPVVWQGDRVPRDKKIIRHRQATISSTVFLIGCACCIIGIILAVCFLAFNLYYRKLRYIKLSSPILNDVAVIGCILVYTAVIVLGLDDSILPLNVFPFICTLRVLLFAAGFSLAFGAMFAKTYRVHQILTRAHTGLVKNKLLRDKHLLFMIGALLILDSAIVFVWVLVDPMHRQITNLTTIASEEDEDIWYISQLATCHSDHLQKWTGAFYVYKGLLLIFGVYMAWETRSVKIPALNDSQYIGMNVYNVVIMSISVVVLSNILSMEPTLAYIVESSFMVLSTTVTLCLLFVPKIYAIVTSGGNPVIASSGIHVEANTRRFVIDDKKEIYYRAEVQNRVYKRELVEVQQEMNRLRRLLELPVEPFSRMTDELLHLLPESKVDGTPDIQRRRIEERRRYLTGCNSISDDGEVCYGSEETDGFPDMRFSAQNASPRASQKRHSTQETSNESAIRKLCRISRSLSIAQTPPLSLKLGKTLKVPSSKHKSRSVEYDSDEDGERLKFKNNSCTELSTKSKSDNAKPLNTFQNLFGLGESFQKFKRGNSESRDDQSSIGSTLELNFLKPACDEVQCGGNGKKHVEFQRIDNDLCEANGNARERRQKLHSPPPHIRIKHVISKTDMMYNHMPLRRMSKGFDNSGLSGRFPIELDSLTIDQLCDRATQQSAHLNNSPSHLYSTHPTHPTHISPSCESPSLNSPYPPSFHFLQTDNLSACSSPTCSSQTSLNLLSPFRSSTHSLIRTPTHSLSSQDVHSIKQTPVHYRSSEDFCSSNSSNINLELCSPKINAVRSSDQSDQDVDLLLMFQESRNGSSRTSDDLPPSIMDSINNNSPSPTNDSHITIPQNQTDKSFCPRPNSNVYCGDIVQHLTFPPDCDFCGQPETSRNCDHPVITKCGNDVSILIPKDLTLGQDTGVTTAVALQKCPSIFGSLTHQPLSEQSSSSSYSNEISTETTSSASPSSPTTHDVKPKQSGSLKHKNLGAIAERNMCDMSEETTKPKEIVDFSSGAIPKDAHKEASRKHRKLTRVESSRTVERRLKIRKLQTDLLKIQKELNDLDDLEYDVSEV